MEEKKLNIQLFSFSIIEMSVRYLNIIMPVNNYPYPFLFRHMTVECTYVMRSFYLDRDDVIHH